MKLNLNFISLNNNFNINKIFINTVNPKNLIYKIKIEYSGYYIKALFEPSLLDDDFDQDTHLPSIYDLKTE